MRKLKLSMGILAIVFATLTVASCKDAKKEQNNEEEHQSEMSTEENHSEMNHDNSDGHHDEEATHDNSDGHHDGDSAEMTSEARDIAVSTQKNGATSAIIDAYFQIKNALVTDSKENAAKGGTALLAAFSKFDMKTLTDGTRQEYMEIAESAKEQAEHIVENPIDHQREHFETLSTDINDLITLLGTDKTLYLDYCPMKKVSWLSETKDIKNPFYGSEMLTCGNVKKQIN
ncbi:Protein of unknown function [Flaviramulus basaltis]|uniref:DUF3347 domain-containing protein n=1 Tax=Flaviramulus basaltis TaxID=369401 RepID=A0A1K2IRA2_9FLAO|nr:DUF3347 domain-containing protein [Flaviramulus basaltis]SFZ94778.1 Protein of unknown function [Flaviramulus basaltis]